MKYKACIAAACLVIFTQAYAEEPINVTQGAEDYDWQTCIETKMGDCLNGCATSEDINCKDTCETLSKDKCISEGLTQPQ